MKEAIKNLMLLFSSMLFLLTLIYAVTRPKMETAYQLHAYLRTNFVDSGYNGLKQGIEQAANDYKVEMTFGVLEEEGETQEALLNNEISAGVEGFIFEPSEQEMTVTDKLSLPFVYVNQQKEVGQVPVISADNEKNGYTLGKELAKKEQPNGHVLVVRPEKLYKGDVEVYEGLRRALVEQVISFEELVIAEEPLEETLSLALAKRKYTSVVGLTVETSEGLGKIKKQMTLLNESKLYGFGLSTQLLNFVEQEVLEALGVSNQFAVGYTAVTQLVAHLKKEYRRIPNIDTLLVDKENLFDPDNQKLLFPLTQ